MNIAKKKQTHTRHTENKLVIDNRERERGESFRGKRSRGTNHYVQNKLQGCSLYIVVYTVQHREYSQYFIIITSAVEPLKL